MLSIVPAKVLLRAALRRQKASAEEVVVVAVTALVGEEEKEEVLVVVQILLFLAIQTMNLHRAVHRTVRRAHPPAPPMMVQPAPR